MGRKKKKKGGGGDPAWLVTFTDMMTLMLTFFVLLVSMAHFDERRKLVVLGSIMGTFGMGTEGFDPRTRKNRKVNIEPGPMEEVPDLANLKDLIWEDLEDDLNFQSNRYVQILSISDEVLFAPGTFQLTEKGRTLLNRMLPVLLRIEHPLLLAGHTSTLREELGEDYKVGFKGQEPDDSWALSFLRVSSIYRYLLSRGFASDRLRLEAFGRFRPRYDDLTPEGRKLNKRVDIVLDRRNDGETETLARFKQAGSGPAQSATFRDFIFEFGGEGENQTRPAPGTQPEEGQ